jgi:Arc/MetJ-type ribon-helix-helix transcriptional regulator
MIKVTQETENRINALVASGRFETAEEFITVALRMMEADDKMADSFVAQNQEYLVGALNAAIESPKIELTDDVWQEMRQELDNEIAK